LTLFLVRFSRPAAVVAGSASEAGVGLDDVRGVGRDGGEPFSSRNWRLLLLWAQSESACSRTEYKRKHMNAIKSDENQHTFVVDRLQSCPRISDVLELELDCLH